MKTTTKSALKTILTAGSLPTTEHKIRCYVFLEIKCRVPNVTRRKLEHSPTCILRIGRFHFEDSISKKSFVIPSGLASFKRIK